ncbi:MAG: DUF4249 family protein [Bacteroidetes bacterium]|nr:DUF4249 family protein [Bacteroidota bacterium]
MKFLFKSYIIILITLSSCIKELEIENSTYKQKVVLWAVLDIDSNINLKISGNKGINLNDTLDEKIADISLFEDNVLLKKIWGEKITGTMKIINFNVLAKANKNYMIEVNFADKNIISQITTINKIIKPELEFSKGEGAQFKYTITDDPLIKDAYRFDLKKYYIGVLYDSMLNKVIDSNYTFIKKYDKFDEPSINYNFISFYENNIQHYTFPVSDQLFSGKSKSFLFLLSNPISNTIFVPSGTYANGQPIRNVLVCKKRYAVVKCLKISNEYYQFLITENKNNAILGTSYYNPVNLYSNINGGLGLMCSQSQRTDTVWVLK